MKPFTHIIHDLKKIYDVDPLNLPNHFWYEIDKLENQLLFKWVEKMLSVRHLLQGNDYIRVCGIQHTYREDGSWTDKQKRSIAMDLIKNWDELEIHFEIY